MTTSKNIELKVKWNFCADVGLSIFHNCWETLAFLHLAEEVFCGYIQNNLVAFLKHEKLGIHPTCGKLF